MGLRVGNNLKMSLSLQLDNFRVFIIDEVLVI